MSKIQRTSSNSTSQRNLRKESVSDKQVSSSKTATVPSSSSSTMRSTRKRSAEDEDVVQIVQGTSSSAENDHSHGITQTENKINRKYNENKFNLKLQQKEKDKFESLPEDVRAQCIKAVCRLLIFRGGKKETIQKTTVSETLGKIDPEYKKHTTAVLAKAQRRLEKVTGFAVVTPNAILGHKCAENKSKKQDEFFLTNNLQSDKLAHILQKGNKQACSPGYFGFICAILFCIYTSSGKKAVLEDILIAMRQIDRRFPETFTKNRNDEALAIPELGDDFMGLINRMKKEHYIVLNKREDNTSGEGVEKNVYSLGPRFYLDIGARLLMTEYYRLMHPGEAPDPQVMKEIEEDEKRILDADDEGEEPPAIAA